MRIAVIDLGTNTFNLLLAEVSTNQTFTIIHSERQAVRIGEGGINKKRITDQALARAINTLQYYLATIRKKGGVDKIFAFGTSAIRSADNKNNFLREVKKATGLSIHVISGDDEAYLIYKGVRQALDIGEKPVLILDIGGGSNELLIANHQQIFWQRSFPLGIARIMEQFQFENPIPYETLQAIENYFTNELLLLWNEIQKYSIDTLVGSSGSFDSYRMLALGGEYGNQLSYNIASGDYFQMHQFIIKSTIDQRLEAGLDISRAEMIVAGSIFTNLIVQKTGIKTIIQSEYSLKEGAVHAILHGEFKA